MSIIRVGNIECKKCPLCNNSKVVQNVVNTDAEIAFIAMLPGEEEAKETVLYPLVGRAGKEFDKALVQANIDRKDVSVLNCCLCWEPDNKLIRENFEQCKYNLIGSIKLMSNLKAIICMGNDVVKMITNTNKVVMKNIYLSTIDQHEYGNFSFIPIPHPASVLYKPEPDTIKKFYDGVKYAVEIVKAKKKLTKEKKIFIVKTKEHLYKCIELLKTKNTFAYDTENTSLKFYKAQNICFGFSWENSTAVVFPYMWPDSNKEKLIYYWEEPEREAIKQFLKVMFNDPKKKTIAQNLKYDSLLSFSCLGTQINNPAFDDMLASFLLDSNQKSDLESLVIREIPECAGYKENFWSQFSEKEKEDGTWIFRIEDYWKVLEYCGDDCANTFEIAKILSKRL